MNTLKRTRVRQACDGCRSRKAKCDGVQPRCTPCLTHKGDCVYTISRKRRGLPTGYIHDLGKRNRLYQAVIVRLLSAAADAPATSASELLVKLLSDPAERHALSLNSTGLQRQWQESPCAGYFNQLLEEETDDRDEPVVALVPVAETAAVLDVADGEWQPISLRYHGLSGLISGFSARDITLYEQLLAPGEASPFRVASIFHLQLTTQRSQPAELLRFPTTARKLIDIYFTSTHTYLPMVNRLPVLRYIHQAGEAPPDYNMTALVWAVLALGQAMSEGYLTLPALSLATFYTRNAITCMEHSPALSLETIQAMLIVGYLYYKTGRWDVAWVLILSASRTAIDVRLMNAVDSLSSTSKMNNDARERTWSCVYILNTTFSSRLGRTPLIRAADWPTPVVDEDGWEEWDPWTEPVVVGREPLRLESGRCLSSHNALLRVTSLVNLAITSSLEMPQADKLRLLSISLAYIERCLEDWRLNLPVYCQVDTTLALSLTGMPTYSLALHLMYNLTLCILGVRLSSVVPLVYTHELISRRNRCYTEGVVGTLALLEKTPTERRHQLPFLDYHLTLSLSSPSLLELPPAVKDSVLAKLTSILQQAQTLSIPCQITAKLMDIARTGKPLEARTDAHRERPKSSPPPQAARTGSSSVVLVATGLLQSSKASTALGLEPSSADGLAAVVGGRGQPTLFTVPVPTSFSPIPPPPTKELLSLSVPLRSVSPATDDELDVFMMGNLFPQGETRGDQFLKNLGYMGSAAVSLGSGTKAARPKEQGAENPMRA